MKQFRTTMNVGKVKYLISYHDGVKTHKDGSPFFDIATFKNRLAYTKFRINLLTNNYTETN